MNPWSVDWTDYSGVHHTDPLDINCHCFNPLKTQVLNPNAWTNIPDGTFGAQQSTLRFFRNQRHPSENLNISRDFAWKERLHLNVRVEFDNIFNRLQLPNINVASSYTAAPTLVTSGVNAGAYSGGFGTFTSTAIGGSVLLNGGLGQRTGSFVARLTF
jgi:hypothetical protein